MRRQDLVISGILALSLINCEALKASTTDVPAPWPSFIAQPYTLNGTEIRDGESSSDPTQGSASPAPSRSDIASGWDGTNGASTNCNPQIPGFDRCGLEPSIYTGYYDGGTTWDNIPNSPSMNDDFLFFRMRVNGNPASNGKGLQSTHWNFLIDIDNDGFKEFWIDVNGSTNGGPNSSDLINVYYENNLSQIISNTDPAPSGTKVDEFTACQETTGPNSCPTSHTRVFPVSDLFPNDTSGEYFLEVQIPITSMDSNDGTQQIFPDSPLKFIFSTSSSSTNPLQKDLIFPCPDFNSPCQFGDFTPVTLQYFETQSTQTGTRIQWGTGLETSTLGFDLWVHNGHAWQKINREMIPSDTQDSLEPQHYEFFAKNIWGTQFRIADTSAQLKTTWHGPFLNGEPYGGRIHHEPINWVPIEQANQDRIQQAKTAFIQSKKSQNLNVNLKITESGIYRITYEDLLAHGLDYQYAKANHLALFSNAQPVPMFLETQGPFFGPGSYFEFLGEARQSLYSKHHIYQLKLQPSGTRRIRKIHSQPLPNLAFTDHYLETIKINHNANYSFSSPNPDPWFMEKLLAYDSPEALDLFFEIDHFLDLPGQHLTIDYYGVTNFPIAPDHHLSVSLNQHQIGIDHFDGLKARTLSMPLVQGLLNNGQNRLNLELPADTGADADLIHLESFAVTYPRELVAINDQLTFKSNESQFRVRGFSDSDISVYVVSQGTPVKISSIQQEATEQGTEIRFATNPQHEKTLVISATDALKQAVIQPTNPAPSLMVGSAEYLIISHPLFLSDLELLIQARKDQGLTVKLVNVEDIYNEFSGGNIDPFAIRDYIRHAANHQNLRFVLLVGGDNYDYHGYQYPEAMSFIPSFYRETQALIRFSPSDTPFVDLDDDQIPDLPIGRFPVRTSEHLVNLIEKTLEYDHKTYLNKAVFASDQDETNTSFTQISEKSMLPLSNAWNIQRTYIDDLGLHQARQNFIDAINDGVTFASYLGHSGPTTLSFQKFFTSADAEHELSNQGKPTVFLLWGCWNTYFVYPGYNTLSDKLLLSGSHGAAAVIGSTTLSDATSANLFGDKLTKHLVEPGQTIGKALLLGKQELASTRPDLKSAIQGMNLLGDPALVIQPLPSAPSN